MTGSLTGLAFYDAVGFGVDFIVSYVTPPQGTESAANFGAGSLIGGGGGMFIPSAAGGSGILKFCAIMIGCY